MPHATTRSSPPPAAIPTPAPFAPVHPKHLLHPPPHPPTPVATTRSPPPHTPPAAQPPMPAAPAPPAHPAPARDRPPPTRPAPIAKSPATAPLPPASPPPPTGPATSRPPQPQPSPPQPGARRQSQHSVGSFQKSPLYNPSAADRHFLSGIIFPTLQTRAHRGTTTPAPSASAPSPPESGASVTGVAPGAASFTGGSGR